MCMVHRPILKLLLHAGYKQEGLYELLYHQLYRIISTMKLHIPACDFFPTRIKQGNLHNFLAQNVVRSRNACTFKMSTGQRNHGEIDVICRQVTTVNFIKYFLTRIVSV